MQKNMQSSVCAPTNNLTPQHVVAAISNPNFYQNQTQFWNMLSFLFSDYNGQKVWRHLQADTFRSIVEQTQVVMESTHDYSQISNNKKILYHLYFISLSSIRGNRTISEFQAYEKTSVIKAIYYLYKHLRQVKFEMPLFCDIPKDLNF